MRLKRRRKRGVAGRAAGVACTLEEFLENKRLERGLRCGEDLR